MSNDSLPRLGDGEEYERRPLSVRTYDIEHDAKIIAWRIDCFVRAGIEALHANALAIRRDIDRERVERMARAGCSSSRIGAILL